MNKSILITNDDGIQSPGLHAAIEASLSLGEVTIIAPEKLGTGMGRSIQGNWEDTLHETELPLDSGSVRAYYCDCSPALTVLHGLQILFHDRKPDLLISGINYGENPGTTVTQSGTVGAAYQAATAGIPSLAVSLETEINRYYEYDHIDWSSAQYFLRIFAEKMLEQRMPADVDMLKVDVPKEADEDTPWRVTRLSRQQYYHATQPKPSLSSKISDYELTIEVDLETLHPRSDIHALHMDKCVSVTPLSLDFTSRVELDDLEEQLRSR
jgi:5'-nucleotidase